MELIKLSVIEVYEEINGTLFRQLQQNAQMIGDGTVLVHRLRAEFNRIAVLQ